MLPKPSRISLFGGRCEEHKVNVLETQRPVMIQFLRRIEKIIYKLDFNVNVKRKKRKRVLPRAEVESRSALDTAINVLRERWLKF